MRVVATGSHRVPARGATRALALAILAAAAQFGACGGDPADAPATGGEIVWYTSLPHERALAVADAYREETGVVVNFLLDTDDELIARLEEKAHYPGADVLMLDGAGDLARALEADVLRPVALVPPVQTVAGAPADSDGYWYGAGLVADVIVYARGAADAAALAGYADLADPRYEGRLCLRRGIDERSRALVAALIAQLGEREAELVVRGWRNNLAKSVFDNEDDLVAAVAAGGCELAIAGSDSVVRLLRQRPGAALGVHVPDAGGGGVQVHPLAAGVTRHANDPEGAARFLGWLLSVPGQRALNEASARVPVHPDVAPPEVLSPALPLAVPAVSPSQAGFSYERAILLIERARYR